MKKINDFKIVCVSILITILLILPLTSTQIGIEPIITEDLNGNIVISDTTAPIIENLTVSTEIIEAGDTLIIWVDVWDESGIDVVWVEINGIDIQLEHISGNTYEAQWIPSIVGTWLFLIRAWDNYDNWGYLSGIPITVVDTQAPVFSNLIITPEILFAGDVITFKIDAWDGTGIDWIYIQIANGTYDAGNLTYVSGNTYEYQWTTTMADFYLWGIEAWDAYGHVSNIFGSITVLEPDIPAYLFIDDLDPDYNWAHTLNQGWCTGSGTWSDPYIIENLIINAISSPTGSGIFINNSKNEYFIIKNCTVYNAGSGSYDAGIRLENTNKGTIINNTCSNNDRNGILLFNCDNNTITESIANGNPHGIRLMNYCDNNTILGNTANKNSRGIYLNNYCDNNTISGNTVNNNVNGIYLRNYCDNNIISGNTANKNRDYGIFLDTFCLYNTISGNNVGNNNAGIILYMHCDNNTILGNTVNYNVGGISFSNYCDNNTISKNIINHNDYGINFWRYCNNNTILGNTANYNLVGIFFSNYCDDNNISGNIVNDNNEGISLYTYCNKNTISGNVIYYNSIGVYLDGYCYNNRIEKNVIVSINEPFIRDSGVNTIYISNYYLYAPPSFTVEIIDLFFSTTEFDIAIIISGQCTILEVSDLFIQMWWNGIAVPLNKITDLGNGLYNVSLTPILVAPGEDPILLNMTISAAYHLDKYFEMYIGVDPEAVFKGNTPAGTDVEVIDETTGVNVTFSEVTDGGTTIIEKSEEAPEPPGGFEVAGDYYDITTDASYSGLISLAIPYNESMVIGNEENLKILHWDPSTGWTDVTTGIDTVKNIVYGEFTTLSTFVVLEKVEHEYIMWEIDQLIQAINNPDVCWRKNNNRNTMENKLIELKELISSNELAEAYDKLLHDIKPKLTGLKTDENEKPWGNGVFKNPWVTCVNFQEVFCSDCNKILNHLSVLHAELVIGSLNIYESIQPIYFSFSLMGLLGIVFVQYFRSKQKLKPLRTESYENK